MIGLEMFCVGEMGWSCTTTAHMLATQGSSAAQAMAQAQGMLYGMLQRQAAMLAFVDSFWVLGVIFLAVIPLMFFIKKVGPHKGPVVME